MPLPLRSGEALTLPRDLPAIPGVRFGTAGAPRSQRWEAGVRGGDVLPPQPKKRKVDPDHRPSPPQGPLEPPPGTAPEPDTNPTSAPGPTTPMTPPLRKTDPKHTLSKWVVVRRVGPPGASARAKGLRIAFKEKEKNSAPPSILFPVTAHPSGLLPSLTCPTFLFRSRENHVDASSYSRSLPRADRVPTCRPSASRPERGHTTPTVSVLVSDERRTGICCEGFEERARKQLSLLPNLR